MSEKGDKYRKYIASNAWKSKADERRQLDNYCCVVCKAEQGDGRKLDVHHITYERLFDEDVRRDLITVCSSCHWLMEQLRRHHDYSLREIAVPARLDKQRIIQNGNAGKKVPIDWSRPNANAQRANGRPIEQVRKGSEEYFSQAEKD